MPGKAKLAIGILAVAATALISYLVSAPFPLPAYATIGFGILCFLAEQFPVPLRYRAEYSVGFVITMAALVSSGPAVAAVAAAFGGISLRRLEGRRPEFLKHVFNASQLAITTGLAGLAYAATVPKPYFADPGRVALPPMVDLIVPVVLATLVNFAVNTGLVSTMITLALRQKLRSIWRQQYLSLSAGHIAFATLGVLFAVLYVQMGWGAILFLLVPLLVARHAFQASAQWQRSYDATVTSLITAIEKKDFYTRGHAGRVADLAEMVAREMRLSGDRLRVIRFAALMHDVGKLGVSTRILQKPGKLTHEEYEHMKQHPIRGHEIVGEIDFLAEAVGAVRHHHEKLDGTGYPDGLKGEEIPLLARIITVVDAFDSMTSTRVYRQAKSHDEAFAELHRCEGTQFDPGPIAALERAIARHGWQAAPEAHAVPETSPHQEDGDARAATI